MRTAILLLLAISFLSPTDSLQAQGIECLDGKITSPASGQIHDCASITLLAHILPSEMGHATGLNDMWGWSDDESDLEVVLVGWKDGVSVIDVTHPSRPLYIGLIPRPPGTAGSVWRDIKVYGHYAFIVAESDSGPTFHGVQVIDLSALRGHTGERQILLPVALYEGIGFAHNIVINEETGFAYAVGSSGGDSCGGGLHAIDISDPLSPVFAGCITDLRTVRGYTHDAQCVVYNGPDTDHVGKEICIGSNESAITIIDVSDKSNPEFLGVGSYANAQYVHQAWLSEDHRFLFQNDELDELRVISIRNTRTLVWDIEDLDDPVLLTEFFSVNRSIDHNLYVKGGLMYQSNYVDGLRILDISDPENLSEIAYFDTHPTAQGSVWNGSWSNYPFLRSGAIAVVSNPDGVFILCVASQICSSQAVNAEQADELPARARLNPAYPNPFNPRTTISFSLPVDSSVRISVINSLGREVAVLIDSALASGTHSVVFDAKGMPSGLYLVRLASGGSISTKLIVLLK